MKAQAPPAGFTTQTVVSGLNQAVGLTFSKDGNYMFVWEKAGKVWVVKNGIKTLLIDISEEVGNWGDLGMLGFALHPQFDVNGYFYLLYVVDRHHLLHYGTANYSATTNEYFNASIGRLTRYTATKNGTGDYVINSNSRNILLGESKTTGIPILSTLHGTGSLAFGTDGTLLVSCGDGAHASPNSDVGNASYSPAALNDGIIPAEQNVGAYRAQQLESLSGKLLRIDPETGNGVPSNPFYNAAAARSARSRVWALGFRNPFRITLMPGSGSTNPSDGKPGILYVGDVGMNRWEELNIAIDAGENFGWPHFEGMTLNEPVDGGISFPDKNVENPYAPNPLFGVNGCTQRYFKFGDLLKQAQLDHSPAFPNPCNTAQSVPASINTFMHDRPTIDWKHGSVGPVRAGIYTADGQAATVNIGAADSPISGAQFGGNASVAGVFYTRDDFPAEYINSYFHGDYASGWIKNMVLDASNKPVAVKNFINTGATVVCMATHPTQEGLYYINYQTEVRKVYYANNLPPLVEASVNKNYGIGPLAVQFTGSNSSDPEGSALTYEWNFGDGSAVSTLPDPGHTYNAPAGVPTRYNVTLQVKDVNGATTVNNSLFISVNNTPPVVNITSPAEGTKYSVASETNYILKATVTDAQHSGSGLSYQWQTTLHHENHIHPGPIDTEIQPTTTLSPEGCNGEIFFYTISLTVTDAAGLSASDEIILQPNCNPVTVNNVTNLAATPLDKQVRLSWTNPASLDEVMIVAKAGTAITASPIGDGSAYVASTNYSNGGSSFDGGKVVYKGKIIPQTITGLTNNTLYYFKVFTRIGANWSDGIQTSATPFVATTLPAPWKNTDVGAVGLAGSASFSNGTFTTKGAGFDFWNAPDNFHFVYQPISGNTTLIARIASIQNTNKDAKAGIMIRENLTENASFVATVVHPTAKLLMSRQGTGKPAYIVKSGSAPVWVKLVRSGNSFTSSFSSNGTSWTTIGTVNITMGTTVYVGMAVTSHNTAVLNTSTFTNVSVTGQPAAGARIDYAPENTEQKLAVSIHPNPNPGNKIEVAMTGFAQKEKAGVILRDVSGQVVDTESGIADEEGNMRLTLTPSFRLKAGIYIIQIRSGTTVLHKKVVVQ